MKLTVEELRRLIADGEVTAGFRGGDPFGLAPVIRRFNTAFTGDPLTPADAMALSNTVDYSSFAPTQDGRLHLDSAIVDDFASYLKGEANEFRGETEIRIEWQDRMIRGLLPPDSSHDFRRLDLTLMEHCGQSVHDTADPRHPARWFDRDDLRDRCRSDIEFARLPKEEREARTRETLKRSLG